MINELKNKINAYRIARKAPWTADDKARLFTGIWIIATFGIACVLDMVFGLPTVAMIVGFTMIGGPIAVVAVWFIISLADGLLYDHYRKKIRGEE